MEEQRKENKSYHLLYIGLIALLLGGLVFTSLKLKKQKETIVVTENQRDDVSALKAELELKYNAALSDIETYRIENAGLDSILNLKEIELNDKRKKIDALLAQSGNNKNALAQAQQLIKELESEKIAFKNTIDSLISMNSELYTKNENLNAELNLTKEEKEKIANQKLALEEEKSKMLDKIDKASILSVANIICTPIRVNKKGKEEEVSKAKDAQKLRICFDLLQNKIAPKGQTELVVRIIGVDGSTIQIQSLGSGTMTEATTGNQIPYTYSISPSYDNETKQVCSYWKQNYSFVPGKYSVEVYQKGLLIGQSSFNLR
jgi:hypothetical protein